jgi:hypothetical protein
LPIIGKDAGDSWQITQCVNLSGGDFEHALIVTVLI